MDISLARPKLRALDIRVVQDGGRPYLHLRDPLALSGTELMMPMPLTPLLALCDGTRDPASIRIAFTLLHGISLPPDRIEFILQQLNDALLLEGPRFEAARQEALARYRNAPHRPPALAGPSYPADPAALKETLDAYCRSFPSTSRNGAAPIRGLLSPHIDYHRGHQVYAQTWQGVEESLKDCELVIVLGTDHAGGAGRVTLTRQSYATPWGPVPTNTALVEELMSALGEDAALAEEAHHIREHSIELATIWLHYCLRKAGRDGAPITMVPILCGHMAPFIQGEESPRRHPAFRHFAEVLGRAMRTRKTLLVAAGDLAHVGPAFGDPVPWSPLDRARLQASDEASLQAICQGDAEGFLQGIRLEGDRRRVCGLTPIYLALRLLGPGVRGEVTGYSQCPADSEGASLVSIAGAIWR